MNLEDEKRLIESIKRLLSPDEYCSEFRLDENNGEVDFSLDSHLIKAIEIFRKAKDYQSSLECSKQFVEVHAESPGAFQRLIQDYLTFDCIGEALQIAITAANKFPYNR